MQSTTYRALRARSTTPLNYPLLDPGLGARAQGEWRAASIARGSRRTRSEKRSGWDSASVGHLVCLVQACVKGLYLYLYL